MQSADFLRLPLDKEVFKNFEEQATQLFIETSPSERCDRFDSLNEAIEMHEKDFQ